LITYFAHLGSDTLHRFLLVIGPYDAIHVGAAAPSVPQALIDQLAKPGRMFIPVGNHTQYIEQIDKDEQGNVETKRIMGVRVSIALNYSINQTNAISCIL